MRRLAVAAALSVLVFAAAGAEPRTGRIVRLSFVGDIMCHAANLATPDYHDIYRGIQDLLLSDDLTLANLETPVDPARPPATYPLFNVPPSYLDAAAVAGVDVFCLANNHAFDQGLEGVLATPREIARASRAVGRPLFANGTRADPSRSWEPTTIDLDGLKIGFLAVARFLNLPGGTSWIDTVSDLDQAAGDRFVQWISTIAPRYDLFILSYHGDREYEVTPAPQKTAFFERLAASGVTIVFGTHPHVLQAPRFVEVPGARRLVLTSMGNFISAMGINLDPATGRGEVPGTADSAVVQVDVRCGAGPATVVDARAVLVATYRNLRGELVIGRLSSLAAGETGLAPVWTAWYGKRLAALKELLAGVMPAE